MFIPLGDDNSDRRIVPWVNFALIAANVLVFVFLQGFGTNARFTYALSMVPEEILTGRDVVTEDRVVADPETGEQFRLPGLQSTPLSLYLTLLTSIVLGGYLPLFPKRSVRVLILRMVTTVPAIGAIGMWFVFQLIGGLGMLGGSETGVAYGAHIGGFVAGFALVKPFMLGLPPVDPQWMSRRTSR